MKTILILFILGFFTISSSKEFTSISVFHLGNIFPTEINHQHLFTNMNQSRTRYRVYEKLGDYDSIFIDAIPSVGIMHTIIGNKDLNYSNKNSIFTELRTLIKHLEIGRASCRERVFRAV